MTFAAIPDNVSVFVDANTLVYHFGPHPTHQAACQTLLGRVFRREIIGVTSTHVLHDVAHRIMTLEAIQQFGWPTKGIAYRLRKHPNEIKRLNQFRLVVSAVPQIGLQVLAITPVLVIHAADLSQQHGLLSGDALIVATMRDQGIVHLASNDDDFDRVPGLTRYSPV